MWYTHEKRKYTMKKTYESVKRAYPVIITEDKTSPQPFLVYIPDFESNTAGKNLVEAIEMARNAISEEGIARQDLGLAIPEPNLTITPKSNEIMSLVDIDLDRYRRLTDSRTVKKTVTIPSYLNELGNDRDINFSMVLTQALKKELGIN